MSGRGRKARNLNADTTFNARHEVQKSFLLDGEVCEASDGTDLNVSSLVVGNNGFNAQPSRNNDAGTSACNGYLDGKLDKHSISGKSRHLCNFCLFDYLFTVRVIECKCIFCKNLDILVMFPVIWYF